MKKFLSAFLSITLVSVILLLTGCQSKEPASKDKESDDNSFKIARKGFNDVHPASKDLWMWKKYEEMTGVHIEWEEIPDASMDERKNIILASNDLPDAFYQIGFSQDELNKYGKQGLFIPLEDLIEEHAPNIRELFKDNPDIKQALTMPDGHIYSLPYVDFSKEYASIRYYINKKWLDNLGLSVPETTEEFANALKAFVDKDANGNGDSDDEHGWYMSSGTLNWALERQLFGSFGMGNGGGNAAEQFIYKDESGELQTIFDDEKYKKVWKYLNELWVDGALHPQTFSGADYAQWVSDANEDKVGAFSWVGPGYIGENIRKDFVGINALKGPEGDQLLNWLDPPTRGISSFIITNVNKDPAETLKWVDYFYGEEGSMFGFIGLEGETYNLVDGEPVYIDEIKDYKGGQQLGAFQYVDNVYGGGYPYVEPPVELRVGIRGMTIEDDIQANAEETEKYAPDELWPTFAPTEEESNELSAIFTDISNYIEEMRAQFITGELSLDKDWDNYVNTLKKMGSERYLEIKREQYERYKSSN
ncbi:extracellular solute-binding protein [Bacillus sp. FSL K6-3431]|uniref:extracellular solute-binding protein n=1 Tax=Bacillus sp. FSL K6-3431 TaxID=2921500 RepID=UPI0030FB157B